MSFLQAHTMAMGMSTAKWMALPVQMLPVAALTPTQDVAGELWQQRRPNPVACADECVHVVQLGRALYLEDGHHRWARARRDHVELIAARLLVIL